MDQQARLTCSDFPYWCGNCTLRDCVEDVDERARQSERVAKDLDARAKRVDALQEQL